MFKCYLMASHPTVVFGQKLSATVSVLKHQGKAEVDIGNIKRPKTQSFKCL